MEQLLKTKGQQTLTDHLRVIFKDVLDAIGGFLNSLGIHPNTLTYLGVMGTLVGSYYVGHGQLILGGAIILLMGPMDALDGTIARLRGEPEDFGAFVDSVSDRYIELFIYGGLLWYFVSINDLRAMLLSFTAAGGSILVSYIRARAQGLGFEAKVGWFTRVERFVVLGPSIFLGYPLIGVVVIAVGANLTAIQRILYVRRESRSRTQIRH